MTLGNGYLGVGEGGVLGRTQGWGTLLAVAPTIRPQQGTGVSNSSIDWSCLAAVPDQRRRCLIGVVPEELWGFGERGVIDKRHSQC